MKKARIVFKLALCLILTLTLLSQAILPVFAQAQPLYLKEIQISTGKTEKEAKQWLIDNGYTVLDEDLNAGTGKDYAYIGYKTTTDKSLAICDISIMSMKSGYKTMNYGALIQQTKDSSVDVIEGVLAALAEFRANYEAGSPNARIAKETLDLLRYDEGSDETLGDYLLSPDRTVDDITNLLFMCNSLVASLIYNQLVVGVSDYREDGTTWLDRISAAEPLPEEMTPYELDMLDDLYYKKAAKLKYSIDNFISDVYDAYERLDENGDFDASGVISTQDEADEYIRQLNEGAAIDSANNDALVIAVYDYLWGYEYGDYTVAELFEEVYDTEDLRLLYPLVESTTGLSEGQISAMQLCGIANMTICTINTEENYEAAHAELLVKGDELLSANNGVKPSAFIGVNKDVYLTEIGLTTAAERAAAASGNYAELTEEDALRGDLKTALMACAMVGLAGIGVSIIAMSVTVGGVIAGFGVFAMIAAVATSAMASVGSFAAAVGMLTPLAAGVIAAVAVVVILVVMLIDWIRDSYNDKHPEYTEIPATMFDYDMKTSEYIRYYAVKERGGDPGDVNCFQGRLWNALYVSYDPGAGSPITANSMGEFFRVKRGNSEVADTYVGLSYFGETGVANLNSNTYKDKVNGLYLFYTTEDSLAGITAEAQSGRYLSSIMIVQKETPEEAKLAIKKMAGYEVLEFNLTPGYHKRYTYIGYSTTANPANAITDIRVHVATPVSADNSEDLTGSNITFGNGGAAYACAGVFAYEYTGGVREGFMLYYTKQSSCGDPIMADFYTTRDFSDVPEGYEPVNYFSGGPAVNLSSRNGIAVGSKDANNHSYIYFRYENPYEGEKIYLGGLAVMEMHKDTTKHTTMEKMAQDLGWQPINVDLKNVDSKYQNYGGLRLCYTATNNPKRAIYDIRTYLAEPKATSVMSNINFDGAGYMILDGYEMENAEYCLRTNHNLFIDSDLTDNVNRIPVDTINTTLYAGTDVNGNGIYSTESLAPRAMGIYVCGPMVDNTATNESDRKVIEPILISEFYVGSKESAPEGLSAVVDFTDYYGEKPVDISANRGVYIYYNETYPEKLKYIESIEIVYSDTANFSHDEAKLTLLSKGGHEILEFNLASASGSIMYEFPNSMGVSNYYNKNYSDRAAFIRVTRTEKKAMAMEDIRIVEVGANDPEPEKRIKIDGYTYTRASNRILSARIMGMTYDSTDKVAFPKPNLQPYYFYVYVGGNGVAVTEITIDGNALNSKQLTALDQNGKTNVHNPWWIHMISPEIDEMKYISSVGVVSAGNYSDDRAREYYCGEAANVYNKMYCEILNKGFSFTTKYDFNCNTQKGNMVYIGYNKTKNPNKAITGLITSEQYSSTISVGGVQYTLGTGTSFNDSLKCGNNIYLYYTTDPSVGKPILQMVGMASSIKSREFVQRAEGGISNLNLNAADKKPDCNGDYTLMAHYIMLIREGDAPIPVVNLTASAFSENPQLKLVVVVAGFAVLFAAGALAMKKAKSKKNYDMGENGNEDRN